MSLWGDHVVPRIVNAALNTKETREIRARVCSGLSGEVVEIGFGSGLNLPHLPAAVTSLRAVEPAGLGVRLAGERIRAAAVPVQIVGLDGQRLPLGDASADAVLCTWSLCTIPDPVAAVREMRRVLRPGGSLRSSSTGWLRTPAYGDGSGGSTRCRSGWVVAVISTATSPGSWLPAGCA